jgi:formate--tetrahydrofolate ligase
MRMPTSSEIARRARAYPITQIAKSLSIDDEELLLYGHDKAKVHISALERRVNKPDGKLILVTAITPTSFGEGKTTTTIGLGQAFGRLQKRAMIAIREPSLGPVFGIKGGATGGGYAQVLPREDINLHFTGDFAAIEKANNLLAALIDNHLHHGNSLGLDPREITFKRCFDMNDRALRQIILGLGGPAGGIPREGGFQITAASEVMAIMSLAQSLSDLQERLGRIVVGYSHEGRPVLAQELKAAGAMTALVRDALHPNLVQTLEHTPAFVHMGPFGNIAPGTSSLIATQLALKLADYVLTEAGFASDLGGEKFFDIKCRVGGLKPSAVVLVATIRALKVHGGVKTDPVSLEREYPKAVEKGLENLEKHIENIEHFGVPVVVAINRFPSDSPHEIQVVLDYCRGRKVEAALSEVFERGGDGGLELAEKAIELADSGRARFQCLYEPEAPLTQKIETLAQKMYGAEGVEYTSTAKSKLARFEKHGYGRSLICMAKTQASLSDDPKLFGRPRGFTITIRDAELSAGAGFVVPLAGQILTMPGLPAQPAAEEMGVDEDGNIHGLF